MTPQISVGWPNGGTNPAHLFCSERKITGGWAAEIGVHLPQELVFKGDRTLVHMPWGYPPPFDPARFPLDSLVLAEQAGLSQLTDFSGFVGAFQQFHQATGKPLDFYLGYPGYCTLVDPTTMDGLMKCIAPIVRLHTLGVPVTIVLDSALADEPYGKTLSAETSFMVMLLIRKLGIPCGGEPRPQFDFWNRKDTAIVSNRSAWHTMGGVPADKLLNRPTLLMPDPSDTAGALTELRAGNNICFLGYPPNPAEWYRKALAAGVEMS